VLELAETCGALAGKAVAVHPVLKERRLIIEPKVVPV
jgi:hypothetical protein